MQALTFIGDVGCIIVALAALFLVVLNWRTAKDLPLHVTNRKRNYKHRYHALTWRVREYFDRLAVAIDGGYGDIVKREATTAMHFLDFGGVLIIANMIGIILFKVGKLLF